MEIMIIPSTRKCAAVKTKKPTAFEREKAKKAKKQEKMKEAIRIALQPPVIQTSDFDEHDKFYEEFSEKKETDPKKLIMKDLKRLI